jgi:two-component system chemotaxis response regulator CheY
MAYNILIVDDSETVRAVISKTLGLAGLSVGEIHQAGNGQEALVVLKDKWVDLVFTDINMPVMTGVELVERMQQDDILKTVPVVVVSTEGSKTRIEDLIQKGVRAYVRKPFTPEILRDTVEQILGG